MPEESTGNICRTFLQNKELYLPKRRKRERGNDEK